jgi:hypothetical protein
VIRCAPNLFDSWFSKLFFGVLDLALSIFLERYGCTDGEYRLESVRSPHEPFIYCATTMTTKRHIATGGKASLASPADERRFDSSKPQFRKASKQVSKVVLDERFASVLTDPRFQLATADKYGRKQSTKKSNDVENLAEFYTVEGERDGHDSRVAASKRTPTNDIERDHSPGAQPLSAGDDKAKKSERKGPILSEKISDDPAGRIAYLTALSRGEVDVSSSSDDERDDEPEDDDSDNGDNSVADGEAIGVLDPSSHVNEQIEMTTEESPYMAVMNMDWSHVRAVDIFSILSSFTPAGAVKRVQVYPSDFGMERMKKDQLFGPVDVWRKPRASNGNASGRGHIDDEGKDGSIDNDDEEAGDANSEEGDNSDLDSDSDTPNDTKATDFDPEKLRRYEASRLKYYFAVVEFASPQHADIAYKQVDGMEFEHSSAAIDLRSIPIESLDSVRENRELRDEATMIPSTYVPPEFVVNALQQSTVQCTWDMGNQDRESLLTKYQSGQTWNKVTDGDDLKVYLASDNSSDEESVSDEENDKAAKMRKMLGLDSDDEENDEGVPNEDDSDRGDDDSENGSSEEEGNKQVRFIPGESDLASKLREKLAPKSTVSDDLTPWEKYQEKRKQKKREKRAAAREKRKEIACVRKNGGVSGDEKLRKEDDFFVDSAADAFVEKNEENPGERRPDALLTDGDDSDDERDFDMRGLERIEKNKEKKLHGARKRKEDKLAANVTGSVFKVDTTDERFGAVLEGTDDRFGIDRTDPSFRETPAMREILAEQNRRKRKRKLLSSSADTLDESKLPSASATLTALASRIKKKVS